MIFISCLILAVTVFYLFGRVVFLRLAHYYDDSERAADHASDLHEGRHLLDYYGSHYGLESSRLAVDGLHGTSVTALETHGQEDDSDCDAKVDNGTVEELASCQRVALTEPHGQESGSNENKHDNVAVIISLRDITASAQALLNAHGVE